MPFGTGAVLCGGRSTRMGRDKAFVEVRGRPLVGVAVAALRDAGASRILAVGGDRDRLVDLGLTFVADRHPGEGPLGAVISALAAADEAGAIDEVVVVLSCDLFAVTGDAVRAVVAGLGDADAAVPVVDERAQVLLAAYRTRAVPVLEAAFAAGERALHRVLPSLAVAWIDLADHSWTANANRPEELPA